MNTVALSLVLSAGFIHAVWNIVAKKAGGDARFAFFTAAVLMLVWAPVGGWFAWNAVSGWAIFEWNFILASGILHVLYYGHLEKPLIMTDFGKILVLGC